ncbi:MAG: LamG-like jellyroll fold domain-containing protein [Planctomycetota bacterium]
MTMHADQRDELLDLAADYVHGTITAAAGSRLEALLQASPGARRDFVDYCMLHGQIALSTTAVGPGDRAVRPVRRAGAAIPGIGRVAAMVSGLTLAGCLTLMLVWTARGSRGSLGPGSYDNRRLPLVTVASLGADGASPTPISPSTLRPDRATALRSESGADVNVAEAAVFGVTAGDSGALYAGSVQARLAVPDANFSVTAANLRIVDKGTAFRVTRIDADHVAVTVLDGEVEVQARVRLPVCYWPFDDAPPGGEGPSVSDAVGGLTATLGTSARVVAGLVGKSAVAFDDSPAAVVRIDGGTGERVGRGLFAMAEGITLEAVIVSAWSGRFGDYDEIFRKEDGDSRVLLSFQNDGTIYEGFSEPAVPRGPCLSFGLHLAGRGYRELDMPLDGQAGRPTLAEITDGKPHHVVATYDSFTGRKAIFIDGRQRFEHVYPVGTLVRCGGPAVAEIGNTRGKEPFCGVIDEVAIYDFALTPDEVEEHHARVRAGETYFGAQPPAPGTPRWQAVTRLVEGESRVFNQATGLPR